MNRYRGCNIQYATIETDYEFGVQYIIFMDGAEIYESEPAFINETEAFKDAKEFIDEMFE